MTERRNIFKDVKFQDCCVDHCRDWRETNGCKYPASNHSPMCENYKLETFFKIAQKGQSSPALILKDKKEYKEYIDIDDDIEYDITEIKLTQDQYEKLDEFDGF